ncbi:MAG: thioredoxin family protein [Saprospiraceae bacterium]|jgi:hypothetical protein|nr:thioredoxin family protein [Saprospiraceae bacterium]MDP4998882.1 thioredoxin family protein [Saprospiraceae bacterium]
MKRTFWLSIVCLLFFAGFSQKMVAQELLTLGSALPQPELEMLDAAGGKKYSFKSSMKENGLLVMFSCNTCPYVLAWEDRFNDIAAACAANKVGFIVLNPNEGTRGSDDSPAAMVEHAREAAYTFPYVIDKNHKMADAFGATRTPELFLFGSDMKLKYTGAIDDNRSAAGVTKKFIFDAISNMVGGKAIDPASTKSIGCTIKRVQS